MAEHLPSESQQPARQTSRGIRSQAEKAAKTGEEQPTKRLSNGFDADKLKAHVASVEDLQGQIDAVMTKAREDCEPLREDIKGVKRKAREDDGIPAREFNTVLRERRLLRQAEERRERLSDEQKDQYDQMKHALGMLAETPLGESALAKAE